MSLNIVLNQTDYNTDVNSSNDTTTESALLPTQVVFYIFLLLDIPSILCSLLLFYYFIYLRAVLNQSYSNQMFLYLLFGSFLITAIDIPLMLPYLHNRYYMLSMNYPRLFCNFWIIYDYGMSATNIWLMALASIERYLLIFFKQSVMRNRKRRFLLYYVLVALVILFILSWYVCVVTIYQCEDSQFDFTQIVCGTPCYEIIGPDPILNAEWILLALVPVCLTILFTLILILHVLYQRHKINRHLVQRDTWKRTRKMFLQLIPVTLTFLLFYMPLIIVGLLSVSDPWYSTTPYFYTNNLSYGFVFLVPFIIFSKQIVIQNRLSTFLRLRRFRRIAQTNTIPLRTRAMNT